MDVALLILRVVVGAYLFAHGAQKLLGWFGGPGLAGTEGFMGNMLRLRPARLWTLAAALSEFGGGLLLVLGLLSPLGSLGIAAAMITATLTAHAGKGWFNTAGGWELPLTNLAVAAAVGIAGPGAISLDHALKIALPEPAIGIAGAILVILGVATTLLTRAPAPAPEPAPSVS
jgi:putative oxidoreductase